MPVAALTRGWLNAQEWGLNHLRRLSPQGRLSANLSVGLRGEQAALFHLRRLGYTIVAQRWTSPRVRGDVDLIGWHGEFLCFIEVKARTARDISPAETAVDQDKKRLLRRLAQAYLKAFPEEKRRKIPVRFDVVAVYLLRTGTEYDVFEGAFGWR
jgi:putative endonuclease